MTYFQYIHVCLPGHCIISPDCNSHPCWIQKISVDHPDAHTWLWYLQSSLLVINSLPVPGKSGDQDEVQHPKDYDVDVRRSSSAWRKLSRKLLLLTCNEYSLEAKGSTKKLADCLDNYFKAIRNERELEQLERNNSTTNAQVTSQVNAHQLATQDPEQAWEPAQPAQPSVADLALSVQNLTEIVIGLSNT